MFRGRHPHPMNNGGQRPAFPPHNPPMMMTRPMPPQPMQQPPRLKPILKGIPGNAPQGNMLMTPTPTAVEQTPLPPMPQPTQQQDPLLASKDEEDDILMEGEDEGVQRRWKRKATGMKVNRKLKRLRLNQKLRKTLQPKNAIMVLNEMKTGVQFTFPETQGSLSSSLFLVHAEIDGKTYVGQGLSKPLARQNAAENALKSLLLEKMTAASLKARIDAETLEAQNQSAKSDSSTLVSKDEEMSEAGNSEMAVDDTDEIPWSSLASFALYKLFLEWQNQGTIVPVPRPGGVTGKIKKEQKINVQKELPLHALNIHPVMLLNQMRPGLVYTEVERAGNPPNTVFTLVVEIDGIPYKGIAKNKRDAKKTAAKAALQALYNLTYPEEPRADNGDQMSQLSE